MTAQRRQFIDRLLRISQINQQLLDIGDKIRQPAYTKRIKLVQMGQAEFKLPQPTPAVYAPRHNCKVFVVDKNSNRYCSQGHKSCKSTERNETFESTVQQSECGGSYRKMIEKRKSTDAYIEQEYQVNFITPVEYEIKKVYGKKSQQSKRPQTSCNPKSASISSKALFKGNVKGESVFEPKGNQKNVLSGKSIKFTRSNTLNFEKDKKIEEERKAKINKMKQINKNYAKPFNPPPKLTAKSYIVCEVINHKISPIVCFNSKNSQEVASLTKIMTCVITIEVAEQFKLDIDQEQVKIGKYQSSIGGTTASIKPGQIYTVRDLMYGLMLPSGNDASLALAVWAGRKLLENSSDLTESDGDPRLGIEIMLKKATKGTCYTRFIKEMNEKAKDLGMLKTKYANSHGLSNSANRSTSYDIALLSCYAMRHPLFREIVGSRSYHATIKSQTEVTEVTQVLDEGPQLIEDEPFSPEKKNGRTSSKLSQGKQYFPIQIGWENTHRLLHSRPCEYIGIKTGITPTAGPCLSSMVRINNRQFIIIVLSCHKTSYRFKETETLKKWLCKHTGMANKIRKTSSLKQERQTEDYSDFQEDETNLND